MKEKHIIFRNATISYKVTGKGLPVVFIHGFAEDSSVWDNQIEFLKEDHLLIIPDLPGSGRSTLIEDEDVFIEDYADCIKKILDAENLSKCIMIGHSMGGYITLAFAERYPASLSTFGLFHSSAYADDEAKVETRKKAIGFIKANGPFAFLQTSIPGLFYPQGNSMPADALLEKGKAFSGKALIQYYKAMIARPDRTRILEKAPAAILMIMGEHDKAVPFKHSLEQSHMPRLAYIYILRNSAHMGMQEEPAKANGILAYFLLNQSSIN